MISQSYKPNNNLGFTYQKDCCFCLKGLTKQVRVLKVALMKMKLMLLRARMLHLKQTLLLYNEHYLYLLPFAMSCVLHLWMKNKVRLILIYLHKRLSLPCEFRFTSPDAANVGSNKSKLAAVVGVNKAQASFLWFEKISLNSSIAF